jgi:hypothetical protein
LGCKDEARIYKILNIVETQHVLKKYRPIHEDIWQGPDTAGDVTPEVERIYLEYFPGQSGCSLWRIMQQGSAFRGGRCLVYL